MQCRLTVDCLLARPSLQGRCRTMPGWDGRSVLVKVSEPRRLVYSKNVMRVDLPVGFRTLMSLSKDFNLRRMCTAPYRCKEARGRDRFALVLPEGDTVGEVCSQHLLQLQESWCAHVRSHTASSTCRVQGLMVGPMHGR